MTSTFGSTNVSDEQVLAQPRARPTVSFADHFDPRGSDSRDKDTASPIVQGNEGVRSRTSSIPNRKSGLDETSSLSDMLDDDDVSKSPHRSPATYVPASMSSRAAVQPPFGWHPSGVFYRFTILALVAFILLVGYFSDETIGATTSELRTSLSTLLPYLLFRRWWSTVGSPLASALRLEWPLLPSHSE